MKTKVITIHEDSQNKEWIKGIVGYIDGYVQAADGRPYACVVFKERVVLIPFNCLKVIP